MERTRNEGGTPVPPGTLCTNSAEAEKDAGLGFASAPASAPTASVAATSGDGPIEAGEARRLWAALAAAAGLSALWCAASDIVGLSIVHVLIGGYAVTLSIWGFFAVLLALRLRSGKVSLGWREWVAVAAAGLFSLVPAVNGYGGVRIANAPLMGIACVIALGRVVAPAPDMRLTLGEVASSIASFLTGQLSHLGLLGRLFGGGRRNVASVALGLVAAVAVLMVAVPLLVRADPVFSSLADGVLDLLDIRTPASAVWKALRFVAIACLGFSLLAGAIAATGVPARAADGGTRRIPRVSVVSAVTALVVIDACYLVFIAAEVEYLFGSADPSAVAGYARSGFFELVGVSVLDLCVLGALIALRDGEPRSRVVDACELVLVGTTSVMLASSAWRMHLYVQEYGLSLLRLATLFGMVAIALLLVLAAVRIARPGLHVLEAATVCLAATWLAFALIRPASVVANYNVDGYLSGSLDEIDVSYLEEFGSDALPALGRLAESTAPEAREAAHLRAEMERVVYTIPWGARSVFEVAGWSG